LSDSLASAARHVGRPTVQRPFGQRSTAQSLSERFVVWRDPSAGLYLKGQGHMVARMRAVRCRTEADAGDARDCPTKVRGCCRSANRMTAASTLAILELRHRRRARLPLVGVFATRCRAYVLSVTRARPVRMCRDRFVQNHMLASPADQLSTTG